MLETAAGGLLLIVLFGGFVWFVCAFLGAFVGANKNHALGGFLLGPLFGPLGVIVAFALDGRAQCPKCGGRLEGRRYPTCQHCNIELVWRVGFFSTSVMTAERAAWVDDNAKLSAQVRERSHEQFRQDTHRAGESLKKMGGRFYMAILGSPRFIDNALRRAAGEDNDILYWFFRILAIIIFVGLLCGVTLNAISALASMFNR